MVTEVVAVGSESRSAGAAVGDKPMSPEMIHGSVGEHSSRPLGSDGSAGQGLRCRFPRCSNVDVVGRCLMCSEWVCSKHAPLHPAGFVKPGGVA